MTATLIGIFQGVNKSWNHFEKSGRNVCLMHICPFPLPAKRFITQSPGWKYEAIINDSLATQAWLGISGMSSILLWRVGAVPERLPAVRRV